MLQNHSEDIFDNTFLPGYINSDTIKVVIKDFVNVYPVINHFIETFNFDVDKIKGFTRSSFNKLFYIINIGEFEFINSLTPYIVSKFMKMFNITIIYDKSFTKTDNKVKILYKNIEITLSSRRYESGSYYNSFNIK